MKKNVVFALCALIVFFAVLCGVGHASAKRGATAANPEHTDEQAVGGDSAGSAIKIAIGGVTLSGELYDTALANEIKAYFPLTISMTAYGGREYYGGVDFYPKNASGGRKFFENGDITYCEAHHNMAIFYAQTERPKLSVEVIPIGRVTSDLSVFDAFGDDEEVTFSLSQ